MLDALVPIGSVVRLEGHDWLFVILGYYPDDGDATYDYLAAPFPTGLTAIDGALFFNADAIAEIVSTGYRDEQGEAIIGIVAEIMDAAEAAREAIESETAEQELTPPEGDEAPEGAAGVDEQPFNME